jgi:hypothetical protein
VRGVTFGHGGNDDEGGCHAQPNGGGIGGQRNGATKARSRRAAVQRSERRKRGRSRSKIGHDSSAVKEKSNPLSRSLTDRFSRFHYQTTVGAVIAGYASDNATLPMRPVAFSAVHSNRPARATIGPDDCVRLRELMPAAAVVRHWFFFSSRGPRIRGSASLLGNRCRSTAAPGDEPGSWCFMARQCSAARRSSFENPKGCRNAVRHSRVSPAVARRASHRSVRARLGHTARHGTGSHRARYTEWITTGVGSA